MAKEIKIDREQEKLQEIMQDNAKDHFNNIVGQSYKTSTGSLTFDLETGGGIPNSIVRCAGEAETGKTSFSLNLCKNFLKAKNHRAVYFLSDKDLSDNLIARCGVNFVENIEDWVDGTCYIIRTNAYEMVLNTINLLVKDRQTAKQYLFILDSMDNLAPKAKLEVTDFADANRLGGTGAISAHFFQCFNVLLPRLGHSVIMISQFRDQINADKYNPIHKQMATSGGRAIEHAASWAFQFLPCLNSKEDMFWEKEPYKSKKLGHNCIVQFKKTTNEKTGSKIKYPIIYGRDSGNSIWIEREIFGMLIINGQIKAKGSWLELGEFLLKEIRQVDAEFPDKIQGEDRFVELLMSKPKVSEFLYKFAKDILTN
jgi:RecA/RadA recombinase